MVITSETPQPGIEMILKCNLWTYVQGKVQKEGQKISIEKVYFTF